MNVYIRPRDLEWFMKGIVDELAHVAREGEFLDQEAKSVAETQGIQFRGCR
jgi:hypothetical protein